MAGEPIEGQILLLAAARASVPPKRLPDLVDRVQAALGPRVEDYARQYEVAYETADVVAFFVESGHWADLGEELGFDRREHEAVARAHRDQLLRAGRERDRHAEFETALEVREAALVAR
jgi:hypothetical protein